MLIEASKLHSFYKRYKNQYVFLISLERDIDASRCSKTLHHLMMTIESWFSFLTELPRDLDNLCLHLLKHAIASIR